MPKPAMYGTRWQPSDNNQRRGSQRCVSVLEALKTATGQHRERLLELSNRLKLPFRAATPPQLEDCQNEKVIYDRCSNSYMFPTPRQCVLDLDLSHESSFRSPQDHNRENDFKPYVATNVREDKSIDLDYSCCCPKIRAKLIASQMYLGVHRKTLTEMQKLVFQCTRGSTGIFLYERPTINKMTLKYELIFMGCVSRSVESF